METEKKPRTPQQAFADLVQKAANTALESRLSSKSGQEASARVAMAFRAIAPRTPDIYGCAPQSVVDCVVKSATYDLFPGGLMPDVDLIVSKPSVKDESGRWSKRPYGQWVLEWRPSFRGLRRLVKRHTGIDLIPMCVVDGDTFEWREGLDRNLVHVPNVDAENMDDVGPENLRCGYVVWNDPESGKKDFIVVRKGDILRSRSASESFKYEEKRDKSPWVTSFHPMVLKTLILWAIRRVIPFDPNQIAAMEGAIANADENATPTPVVVDVPSETVKEAPAPTSTAEALNMVLEQKTVPESHQIAQDAEEVSFIPEKVAEKVVIEAKVAETPTVQQAAQATVADKRREILKRQIIEEEAKVDQSAIDSIRKMAGVSGLPIASSKARDEVLQEYLDLLKKHNTPKVATVALPAPIPAPDEDELPFDA